MRKTFKYRLYPNKRQQRLLGQQVEECRWLYNEVLATRRDAWEQRQERHESLRLYDQQATLPTRKAARLRRGGSSRSFSRTRPHARPHARPHGPVGDLSP
jgi:transposase